MTKKINKDNEALRFHLVQIKRHLDLALTTVGAADPEMTDYLSFQLGRILYNARKSRAFFNEHIKDKNEK